jgi:hypothetical protein
VHVGVGVGVAVAVCVCGRGRGRGRGEHEEGATASDFPASQPGERRQVARFTTTSCPWSVASAATVRHRSSTTRYNKLSAVDRPSSIGDRRCVFDHGLPGFRTSPTLSSFRVKRDTRTGLANHRPSVPVPLHPPPSPSMRPAAMNARTLAVIRSNSREF